MLGPINKIPLFYKELINFIISLFYNMSLFVSVIQKFLIYLISEGVSKAGVKGFYYL